MTSHLILKAWMRFRKKNHQDVNIISSNMQWLKSWNIRKSQLIIPSTSSYLTEIRKFSPFIFSPPYPLDYWTLIGIYEWIKISCIILFESVEITQKDTGESNHVNFARVIYNLLRSINFRVNTLSTVSSFIRFYVSTTLQPWGSRYYQNPWARPLTWPRYTSLAQVEDVSSRFSVRLTSTSLYQAHHLS